MECKGTYLRQIQDALPDLIDTLWNVKFHRLRKAVSGRRRFNRYIVECKEGAIWFRDRLSSRFNRYIVECKAWNRNKIGNNETRFNRYIVECKVIVRAICISASFQI